MGENSRLSWLCRRGMKELALVMTRSRDKQDSHEDERKKESMRACLALGDRGC